ncbi:putative vagD (plasmid) [Escherichia coli]|uniref:VagD n=2 Tax=Escherichia coli TaxID=562 RepID=D9Z540_ECOLX|nr:VagD [Escherichia coli APEC O1]ADL13990.1 VagD [Escherichia coli]ADL14114.1 VagD [Escherichia coli]AVJ73664.1 putative vagD [Escherichia coli]
MAFFYSFIYRCLKERPAAPDRLFCFTALSYPVFQHKTRYPLKLSHIIRHQNGTGSDGVSGYRRVVRTDRRAGETQCHLNLRGRIHRGAVPRQDGIEPLTERVNQLHVAWRGLRTGGTEAHLGVGDGRDHDTVTAQHRLLQVLKQCFRLLAHDERADVRVEHIDLVHRLTRPSSLTTSSRSVIKSGSAFSSSRNEPQVGRTGRRMMLSPSRTISSSLTPSKSRSRGRRIARLLPFLKMDTVLMILSRVSVDM